MFLVSEKGERKGILAENIALNYASEEYFPKNEHVFFLKGKANRTFHFK
jgi:hypothetical protein